MLLTLPLGVKAGSQNLKTYMLFNGTNAADSTERFSPWIPIRGATRVYFRTWSAGAIADTDFCDTITTWKTLFSDSVLFVAVDSLGTIVTARSTTPRSVTTHGEPFPMCADSVAISGRAADSTKMVVVINPVEGVAKPVRGSGTGSGYWSIVAPTAVPMSGQNFPIQANAAAYAPPDKFMVGYLRVRITPQTRKTSAGTVSTQGLRTRGINKLKIQAIVVYDNTP
jgi:hypothetical protein